MKIEGWLLEGAIGGPAHCNGWNGVNGMHQTNGNDTFDSIPTLHSSHYNEPVLL